MRAFLIGFMILPLVMCGTLGIAWMAINYPEILFGSIVLLASTGFGYVVYLENDG